MNGTGKVLWREGLFLTPQHFQLQDQHQEWLSWFYAKAVNQYYWGLYRCDIDEDAITNWQFGMKNLQAVMRSGLVLDCPEQDSLPPARSFEELLSPERRSLKVFLGMPLSESGRPAVKMDDEETGRGRPYERSTRQTSDFITGLRPRDIEFMVKKPQIRFEGESADNFDLLPLARIELKGAGKPTLAENFLPPSLSLAASRLWIQIVERLLYQVNSLASEVRSTLTYGSGSSLTLSVADLSRYFQAQELTATVPALLHLYTNSGTHPVQLHYLLTDLVARLGVLFGTLGDSSADDFPAYNHEAPSEAILTMVDRLKQMFSLVGRTSETELPLTPSPDRENEWSCSLSSATFAENEEFYVWAKASMPDDQFLEVFSREFRVAAPDSIDQLIVYALPGIPLNNVINPPTMLPGAQGGHYFRVDTRDPKWRNVVDARELRIAGRKDVFPNLEFRIYILRS